MYLKRITVTGFKSFAGKTVLELERGITAVVGPNGSGKSNLADAVRWALGEQSKSRLRTRDREEVVFAGTDKRARASYAEVVLVFDNQDGVFPLGLTEVEMSRRLYRSGETEYRLAGRSVRLGDLQQLLAEAGFGAGSYAVIGQGMIDNLLLSSPAERKLLFDEAAGIRGAELKRETALRKLAATEANLVRLRDITAELEPRLASLKRRAAAEDEYQTLLGQLAEVRSGILAAAAAEQARGQAELEAEQTEVKAQVGEVRRLAAQLEREQQSQAKAVVAARQHQEKAQQAVLAAEKAYAEQLETVAGLRARHEELRRTLEQDQQGHVRGKQIEQELAAAQRRLSELQEELAANQAAGDRAHRAVTRADEVVAKVQADLVALRQQAADGTQQQYVRHALEVLKVLARGLEDRQSDPQQLRLLVHKAGRLLSHAAKTSEADLLRQLKDMQARLEAAMTRRDTALEHQTNITITRRSLEIDLAHQDSALAGMRQRRDEVAAELQRHQARQAEAEAVAQELATAERQLERAQRELAAARQQLDDRPEGLDPAAVAAAATRLERLRSQQGAAELRLEQLKQALAAVADDRRRYAGLGREWDVQAATEPAASSLAQLEEAATRLEVEITTRRQLQQANAAEYAEVNTRAAELATQIADLEQADIDLRRVVAELDGLIKARFKDNFARLSEAFATAFARLFGGGTAALELEEQADGAYGIAIKVSPKGKRLASLSALSGGERAMAGVALLAAILRVNPSPFVVLDEIDAALDEANSGRLADILEELSAHSQLIIITHNRQTMKAARVLFGVTMNDHHISHLLSLHLEEATALAAR